MVHTCHAHGCEVRVPPKMFMCKRHWFSLRKPMRDAIWREYRPGQEDDKRASTRYMGPISQGGWRRRRTRSPRIGMR
jgi:hypothetical protein